MPQLRATLAALGEPVHRSTSCLDLPRVPSTRPRSRTSLVACRTTKAAVTTSSRAPTPAAAARTTKPAARSSRPSSVTSAPRPWGAGPGATSKPRPWGAGPGDQRPSSVAAAARGRRQGGTKDARPTTAVREAVVAPSPRLSPMEEARSTPSMLPIRKRSIDGLTPVSVRFSQLQLPLSGVKQNAGCGGSPLDWSD